MRILVILALVLVVSRVRARPARQGNQSPLIITDDENKSSGDDDGNQSGGDDDGNQSGGDNDGNQSGGDDGGNKYDYEDIVVCIPKGDDMQLEDSRREH